MVKYPIRMKKKDKEQENEAENVANPSETPPAETVADETCPPETAPAPAPDFTAEIARLQEQYLRMRADFDNYKKRVARDLLDTVKRANEDLIESLLPAFDHFNSAETMMEKKGAEAAPYLEGFRMVKNEMLRVLESRGLKPVAALGATFDHNFHEAVTTQPATEAAPAGTIVFEIRKGYMLHGKVLRHSQVVVAEETNDELRINN